MLKGISYPLFLVSCILVASLAGCQGAKNEGVNDSSKNNQDSEKPLKFSISMSDSTIDYIKKVPDVNNEKWVQEFNKRFNTEMTIRLLEHKKLMEQNQIMFASGDIPDVVTAFDNYTRADLAGSVEAVFT